MSNRFSPLRAACLIPAVLSAACVGPTAPVETSSGRYEMRDDSPLLEPLDPALVKPVIPVAEPRALAGNKSPYTVNGRTYHVLNSGAGYAATGTASWYGRKFHGYTTSSGEIYDMFQLSAAHRTLPVPSFARVTNLENGKSVVVRVNDRGPFHDDRLIDLSYAAAVLLGYAADGTTGVRVEAIVPGRLDVRPATLAIQDAPGPDAGREYLQVGAFANLDAARALMAKLAQLTHLPAFIRSEPAEGASSLLHRVRLGPLNETMDLDALIEAIMSAGLGQPFKVTR